MRNEQTTAYFSLFFILKQEIFHYLDVYFFVTNLGNLHMTYTYPLLPLQGPVSRTSRGLFGPEKLVVKQHSARFQKLIFLHAFNMRKIKRIAKFEGIEPRRCEDIKGIVVRDIGPKSFGTFEKQAPGVEVLIITAFE